jgi:hypothetical protein
MSLPAAVVWLQHDGDKPKTLCNGCDVVEPEIEGGGGITTAPAEQGSPVIEFLPIAGVSIVAESAGETGASGPLVTVFPLRIGLVVFPLRIGLLVFCASAIVMVAVMLNGTPGRILRRRGSQMDFFGFFAILLAPMALALANTGPGGAGWKLLTFLCCTFAAWFFFFASSLLIALVAWVLAWGCAITMRISFNRRRA